MKTWRLDVAKDTQQIFLGTMLEFQEAGGTVAGAETEA